MNKVALVGRLTKEPELKLTSNLTPFCSFTIAVDRRFKDANGQRQTDFINCLAWKQTAQFIQKYFHKGNKIGIIGTLQTRSYDDANGQKRFVTEVIAEEVDFVESNNSNQNQTQVTQTAPVPVQQTAQEAQEEDSGGIGLPFEI